MKRTIKQGTYGKNTFWYILNEPVLKTDRLVVFFPGTGELSMSGGQPVYDGSLINKVSGTGYGKAIIAGAELPFNYLEIQGVKGYDSSIMPWIYLWIWKEFGVKFIVSGVSLGAIATAFSLYKYPGNENILAVCYAAGYADFKNVPAMIDIPGMAVHGDKDTQVNYAQDKNMIEHYNAAKKNKIELVTVPGAGHSGIVWGQAFAVDGRSGSFLPFIIDQFKKNEVLPREDGFYWCKMYNSAWFNIYRYISETGQWLVCGSSISIPETDLEVIDPKKIERI